MAAAGVSYVTGREANSLFNETYDGWQLRDKHQFPDGIDPYRKPGDPQAVCCGGSAVTLPIVPARETDGYKRTTFASA